LLTLVPQSQVVDFARELDVVDKFFARGGFRAAVIGGVALTAYGHPRMTLDLDMVTEAGAQETLVEFMESQGFETLHRSSGYSNHRHSDRNRGRVDFMYVGGHTTDKLFASAKTLPGPGGRSILVPKPEHLIAMKVQAMKDAPERTWEDLVDIAYLFRLDGVNRDEVRRYFETAGLIERWNELTTVR
jgi:nucleotidyltransferase AbiEii toxin of type IV toxin-antitoxin system